MPWRTMCGPPILDHHVAIAAAAGNTTRARTHAMLRYCEYRTTLTVKWLMLCIPRLLSEMESPYSSRPIDLTISTRASHFHLSTVSSDNQPLLTLTCAFQYHSHNSPLAYSLTHKARHLSNPACIYFATGAVSCIGGVALLQTPLEERAH